MNGTGVSRACATAAVLAVLTTTGCRSEPTTAALGVPAAFWHLPPETIRASMLKAVDQEPFLTMSGYLYEDGEEMYVSSVLDRNDNCRADLRTDDGSLKMLGVDDEFYVKFDRKSLRAMAGEGETGDAIVAKLRGRWLKTAELADEDAAFCKRGRMMALVTEGLSDDLAVQGTEFVKQGEAVVLSGRGKDGSVTASVSLDSPHLLYGISDEQRSRVEFTYDDAAPIAKPRPRDIVEIPGLSSDALPV